MSPYLFFSWNTLTPRIHIPSSFLSLNSTTPRSTSMAATVRTKPNFCPSHQLLNTCPRMLNFISFSRSRNVARVVDRQQIHRSMSKEEVINVLKLFVETKCF